MRSGRVQGMPDVDQRAPDPRRRGHATMRDADERRDGHVAHALPARSAG